MHAFTCGGGDQDYFYFIRFFFNIFYRVFIPDYGILKLRANQSLKKKKNESAQGTVLTVSLVLLDVVFLTDAFYIKLFCISTCR